MNRCVCVCVRVGVCSCLLFGEIVDAITNNKCNTNPRVAHRSAYVIYPHYRMPLGALATPARGRAGPHPARGARTRARRSTGRAPLARAAHPGAAHHPSRAISPPRSSRARIITFSLLNLLGRTLYCLI